MIYNDLKMYFYRPWIKFSKYRSWFFTTSPFVIYTIKDTPDFNDDQNDGIFNDHLIQLSILEIDLMLASGFSIVFCAEFTKSLDNCISILNILASHPCIEIHLMIDFNQYFDEFFTYLLDIYDKIE